MFNKRFVPLFFLPSVLGFGLYGLDSSGPIDGYTEDSITEILELKKYTTILEKSGETYKPPLGKVSEDDISLYVYNNANLTETEVFLNDSQNLLDISQFDLSLETVFLLHGWNNYWNSTFNTLLGHSILNISDKNIISINWDKPCQELYTIAQAAVPQVGKYIGQFVNNFTKAYNYSLDNIHLIGHSLGAHVSGFIGKETNGSISTIVGLDPAGPLYFSNFPKVRLCQGDAKYVEVIHTDATLLGASFSVGDADFWPNGGFAQPGCGVDITGTCAHARSYYYFAESLSNNSFVAKKCPNRVQYELGLCKSEPSVLMGGGPVDTTLSGNYHLNTNSESPYGRGDS